MRVTTHTEGRVVTHEHDEPIEVVQLPNRDAATEREAAPPTAAPATPATTPTVKAAVKQRKARTAKSAKSKAKTR